MSTQLGLTQGTLAAALGLLFWLATGTAVVKWYDRKHLFRLHPDLLAYVSRAVQGYNTGQADSQAAAQIQHQGDG